MILNVPTTISTEVLMALKREIFASLHVALPGTVVGFDAEKMTVDVQPGVRRKVGKDGIIVSMPMLMDVPVFCPAFSDPELKVLIQEGDPCLVIFADCNIDGWYETGDATLPASERMHDLADGFAFVGFHIKRGTD